MEEQQKMLRALALVCAMAALQAADASAQETRIDHADGRGSTTVRTDRSGTHTDVVRDGRHTGSSSTGTREHRDAVERNTSAGDRVREVR